MKHLFFVAVTSGILSGTAICAKAQTAAGAERLAGSAQPKVILKFIEDIEILPGAASSQIVAPVEISGSGNQLTIVKPAAVKTGLNGSIELCSALQFKYAERTDREVEAITNVALYNFIDHWWATRYRYGGTDSNGIDCSAFTGKLLSQVYGLTVPRVARDQYKVCEKLSIEELVEGDLVFFNTRGGVSHVGLYLGNNYFVHSSVHEGVTISSLADDYYNKKFIAGGRVTAAATAKIDPSQYSATSTANEGDF